MSRWWLYAFVPLVVFGLNLLPAFAPPTWALLVYFRLRWSLDIVALVALGGAAAGAGRFLLARGTRLLADHLPQDRRKRLEALGARVHRNRAAGAGGLVLFAMSPVPSAQLFEAAGLLRMALVPLTAAFFAGRVVSYTAYLLGAKASEGTSFEKVVTSSFTNPWLVALELVLVTGLVAMLAGATRKRS